MNKQAAVRQIARNQAVLSVLSARADDIAASLASNQKHSGSLQGVLSGLLVHLSGALVSLDWHSKLYRPQVPGNRTVWVLIAPDYSGADRSVVSYRDLFFEKAINQISKQNDTVVCIGADAVDLAVAQGYQIAYSDSKDFSSSARIEELSGFLSRLIVNMALDKGFERSNMLYLGPQQSVNHGLLPFETYEGAADALARASRRRELVFPDTGSFVLDSVSVFVSLAIGVGLARASAFAQTARYQGLLKTRDQVMAEQRKLRSLITAIRGMSLQDEQNSAAVQRRAQGGF